MGTEGAGCARLSWSGARAAASSSSGVPVPRLGRSSGHSGCRAAAPSLEEVAAGQLRARGALQPQRGAGSAPGRGTALSSLSARPARPRGCERRNRRGSGADGAALPPAVLRLLCWRLGNTKLASLQEDFAGAASPLPKGCRIPTSRRMQHPLPGGEQPELSLNTRAVHAAVRQRPEGLCPSLGGRSGHGAFGSEGNADSDAFVGETARFFWVKQ